MKHRRRFVGRLELYELAGHNGEWFCLLEPLTYVDDDGRRYTAQAGTLTNFASVPRVLWSIFPPYGKHTRAAVLHDHLCHRKPIPSRQAHDLLRRMLEACECSWITVRLFHRMVRTFGPRFTGA